MTDLISPENFDFFARYLLAGFIIISVRARFVVGDRPKPAETILEALIFSLINQTIFLLIWPGITFLLTYTPIAPTERLAFFSEVLVLPACIGFLAGINLSQGWRNALLRRLSMPVTHPTRRAYDYAFTHDRPPGFIIISFEDGTQIFGYYGENSLAANDTQRSDIYLERIYEVSEDGQWNETSTGRSALIDLTNVRSIEFLDTQEEDHG